MFNDLLPRRPCIFVGVTVSIEKFACLRVLLQQSPTSFHLFSQSLVGWEVGVEQELRDLEGKNRRRKVHFGVVGVVESFYAMLAVLHYSCDRKCCFDCISSDLDGNFWVGNFQPCKELVDRHDVEKANRADFLHVQEDI